MGGRVADAVMVGSRVRVGAGVMVIVGVGLSFGVGQGVAVTLAVGNAMVAGKVGKGAKASSITLQPPANTTRKRIRNKTIFRSIISTSIFVCDQTVMIPHLQGLANRVISLRFGWFAL